MKRQLASAFIFTLLTCIAASSSIYAIGPTISGGGTSSNGTTVGSSPSGGNTTGGVGCHGHKAYTNSGQVPDQRAWGQTVYLVYEDPFNCWNRINIPGEGNFIDLNAPTPNYTRAVIVQDDYVEYTNPDYSPDNLGTFTDPSR